MIFMKLNWKVRFKNKVWVTSFFAFLVSTVFTFFQMFDVYPSVTENQIIGLVNQGINLLSLLGILVDPTTAGMGDSERAMGYEEPYSDPEE